MPGQRQFCEAKTGEVYKISLSYILLSKDLEWLKKEHKLSQSPRLQWVLCLQLTQGDAVVEQVDQVDGEPADGEDDDHGDEHPVGPPGPRLLQQLPRAIPGQSVVK